jgi:protein-S-isoprenylcysteine O-methyltransferase Ste14
MLLAASVALMLGSPLQIALACACPLCFVALVRREETVLVHHYGETFEEYRGRTPRWPLRLRPEPTLVDLRARRAR